MLERLILDDMPIETPGLKSIDGLITPQVFCQRIVFQHIAAMAIVEEKRRLRSTRPDGLSEPAGLPIFFA